METFFRVRFSFQVWGSMLDGRGHVPKPEEAAHRHRSRLQPSPRRASRAGSLCRWARASGQGQKDRRSRLLLSQLSEPPVKEASAGKLRKEVACVEQATGGGRT